MKKVVVLLVLVGVLMAFAVPSAFAAPTNDQQKELNKIQQQMNDLEKQMVQKYVEAGMITQEQADLMIQDIELKGQYQSQYNNNWGPGYYGGGRSMMRGNGWGGYCW